MGLSADSFNLQWEIDGIGVICFSYTALEKITRGLTEPGRLSQPRTLHLPRTRMSNLIRHSWFLVLASVPTATFLVLGLFSGPAADDFCYAPHLRAYGYFGALKANYLQWQGRYASSSILFLSGYLNPTAVLHWYWVVPTSLILAAVLSIYILLHSFNRFVLVLVAVLQAFI